MTHISVFRNDAAARLPSGFLTRYALHIGKSLSIVLTEGSHFGFSRHSTGKSHQSRNSDFDWELFDKYFDIFA
jgi:hypothetical protein